MTDLARGSRLVAIAPNPSIDRLVEVEAFRRGAIHRPLATTVVAGGKGFNVARVASALGAQVTAIGLLGGHAGRWIAEALARDGVEVVPVWHDGETRTCTSILDRSDGTTTEIYETGPPVEPEAWAQLVEALATTIAPLNRAGAGLVTVSGSLPPGAPSDGLAQIVRVATAAGIRTAVDGSGRALVEGLLAGPWLVKVNLDEAREALQAPAAGPGAAARGLVAAGARHAIVTAGMTGAVAVLEDGSLIRLVPPAVSEHTVGAGDAFLGGLADAVVRGSDLRQAAVAGIAAAASSARVPGAGRIDVSMAVRYRDAVVIESVPERAG